MDYSTIHKRINYMILWSLVFHGLAYNVIDGYRDNNYLKSIFIMIIPAGSLLFILYKYFQTQQSDRVELARIFIFMFGIGVLVMDRLF